MSAIYGKLQLINSTQEGVDQEFELGKASISIGRAQTNDVVLNDSRASRNHALIECKDTGCQIKDLGSTNGVRVNGNLVKAETLKPGDLLTIGNSSLRFQVDAPYEEPGMTMINTVADLEATLNQVPFSISLNETKLPRLVVHTPLKTWEIILDQKMDAVTIGRSSDNTIVLEHAKVSRNHARIEQHIQGFKLVDPGSTNGTWLHDERVSEHWLEDGDAFRIGDAQFLFKKAIDQNDLTLIDGDLLKSQARRPVIFIPGFLGSELWLGNERVWPNVRLMFKQPELFLLNEQSRLEPRGLVGEVVIIPNLVKQEQYNRLGDYLIEELGYQRGVDYFEFAYDFRVDVRESAKKLAQAVDEWAVNQPVTIIAHSLGTLVGRYYVEKLGGKRKTERLLLMGGPHQGTPKAATTLMVGPDILPFGFLGERIRSIMAEFPSMYQILPTYACAVDQNGKEFSLLEDHGWVKEQQRPMVQQAAQFRKELGTRASIPTISIFGYGLKTTSRISFSRDQEGNWKNVAFTVDPNGDNTIPERSAILEGSEIHPVQQHHGALYVDNDVKMRLKLELTRKTK